MYGDLFKASMSLSEHPEVILAEQVSTRAAIVKLKVYARLVVVGAMAIILSVSTGGVANASSFAPIINRELECLDAVNEANGITLLQVHCFNVSNEEWDHDFVGLGY